MEKWKKLQEYEDAYMISSSGKIKCLIRKGINKEKMKCLQKMNTGYLTVALQKDSKTTRKHVHRLVAIHFLPNPNNLPVVNHIDGNKLNNNVTNLQWCTYSENSHHAFITGLAKKCFGNNHYNMKIKDEELEIIFNMSEKRYKQKDIAKKFNVNPTTISRILKKKRRTNKIMI